MGSYWNSITLGWNPVNYVSYYNIYCSWTGQAKYLRAQTPYLSYTLSMGADTNHSLWVAGVSGRGVESAHSGPHQVRSGHPQVSNSGSLTHESRPYQTATWRNDGNNWSYNGDDVLQGWYSNSAYNAYGGVHVDGDAVNNWITANYGAGVVANMSYSDLAIAVYRIAGTGTGSAVSQDWYVSSAIPNSGGQPSLAGGATIGSHVGGDSAWDRGIPPHWAGHVMRHENVPGTGVCHSFIMQRNNSAHYSRYGGRADAGNAMNIYIATNWNFVTQNQANTSGW